MIVYVDRDLARREVMARMGREADREIKCFECGHSASEFLHQQKGLTVIAASEIRGGEKLARALKHHTLILAGEMKECWWEKVPYLATLTFPLDRFEVLPILGASQLKKAA